MQTDAQVLEDAMTTAGDAFEMHQLRVFALTNVAMVWRTIQRIGGLPRYENRCLLNSVEQ